MSSVKYILTYWDNGCYRKEFYTLDFAFTWVRNHNIFHYDLTDTRGNIYHAIFL